MYFIITKTFCVNEDIKKVKKSDGRLQNEKTIRQVVMRFDKKKKKERNKTNKDPHRTYVLLGEDRW